jgi:hypothetical protein
MALVLHEEGFDPVVVVLLAEGLGESLQLGLGKAADGVVNPPDRGAIEV